jgi:putative SOS response-associated peptidase YedK
LPAPATGESSGTLGAVCGRYAASRKPEDLVEEFEVDEVVPRPTDPMSGPTPLRPHWNVAPTDEVYVVVQRGARQLRVVRWGLVPSWATDRSIASRLINARVETVADKPAFRRAFAARRCLVPADGYFEWYAKQPYFITPSDGGVLAMAGVYEVWRDTTRPDGHAESLLWTVAILTTTAEDAVGHLHDRMPLLVERPRYATWLDPATSDPDALRGLLVPAAPGRLDSYPVSTAVGNVRNDGPELVAPLPLAEADEPATLF